MTTRTDYRDALAWLDVHLQQDQQARAVLAEYVDPCGLVDALTDLLLGLAAISTDGRPDLYVSTIRDGLDAVLDKYGVTEE